MLLIVQRAMMDGGRDLPEMDVGDNERRGHSHPPWCLSRVRPRGPRALSLVPATLSEARRPCTLEQKKKETRVDGSPEARFLLGRSIGYAGSPP
jgi:hypothetical protein